jgi:hypothetical protein
VIEGVLALSSGLDEDRELLADLFLPDVFVEHPRAQRPLDDLLLHSGGLPATMRFKRFVFDRHRGF